MSSAEDFMEVARTVQAFMDQTMEGRDLSKKFQNATQDMLNSFDIGVSILVRTIDVQRTMLVLQHALLQEFANPNTTKESRAKLKIRSDAILDQLRKGVEFMPETERTTMNQQFDRYSQWLEKLQSVEDNDLGLES